MYGRSEVLEAVRKLNVYRSSDRRAPHKPPLLLIALGELLRGRRELSYEVVEDKLRPLLDEYAPPVRGRHQPELPYWHLCSDGLWEVSDAGGLERQRGGFLRMPGLIPRSDEKDRGST